MNYGFQGHSSRGMKKKKLSSTFYIHLVNAYPGTAPSHLWALHFIRFCTLYVLPPLHLHLQVERPVGLGALAPRMLVQSECMPAFLVHTSSTWNPEILCHINSNKFSRASIVFFPQSALPRETTRLCRHLWAWESVKQQLLVRYMNKAQMCDSGVHVGTYEAIHVQDQASGRG